MPTSRTLATLIALPLGFAAVAASAQELTKEQLATRLNGIEASDISDAPIPGMYQVAIGANVAYVTKDGKYIIRGDINLSRLRAKTSTESVEHAVEDEPLIPDQVFTQTELKAAAAGDCCG